MKLGKSATPIFYSEKGNCKVIKVCRMGDCFGEVQNIETLETFTTYGYDLLPQVGFMRISVSPVEIVLNQK